MDAVYPAAASALARGRRVRRAAPRLRHRTTPVTFAEIKEVDEDKEVECEEVKQASRSSLVSMASVAEERRRRPDLLGERFDERLDREFAAFRRRRARRQPLREPDELETHETHEPHESHGPHVPRESDGAVANPRAASEPRVSPAPSLPSNTP